jgi:hypothetical protein
MLAKITAKNQLTLPKSLTQAVGATEYFDVQDRGGQLILTPVRMHCGDAKRDKLAELELTDIDMLKAVAWARAQQSPAVLASEPEAGYPPIKAKPSAPSKSRSAK